MSVNNAPPVAAANHFSPSLMLAGMDYIAPSAECILPVTVRGQGTAGVNGGAGGGVGYRRGGGGAADDQSSDHRFGGDVLKITLQDCLACSGCVTTAETILVNSQSREELLKAREASGPAPLLVTISDPTAASVAAYAGLASVEEGYALVAGFVRSVLSPSSPPGTNEVPFYVTDLRWAQAISNTRTAEEYVRRLREDPSSLPLLVSACPGWVCYCEKQGAALLPHLSPVLSPQGIAGSYVKRSLSPLFYHLSLQPCFDRKLEAARDHFLPTTVSGSDHASADAPAGAPVYYTDCVLSTGELLEWMREVDPTLPWRGVLDTHLMSLSANVMRTCTALSASCASTETRVADEAYDAKSESVCGAQLFAAAMEGSGGYHRAVAAHMQRTLNGLGAGTPETPLRLHYEQKRNHNHQLVTCSELPGQVFCVAYGFQQIQNTVRAIKKKLPAARGYTLVELMACPDGCLNGGGQIRSADATAADATLQRVKTVFAHSLHQSTQSPSRTVDVVDEETALAPPPIRHSRVEAYAHETTFDGPFRPDRIREAVHTLGDALWRCAFTDRQKEFEKMLDEGNIQSLKW